MRDANKFYFPKSQYYCFWEIGLRYMLVSQSEKSTIFIPSY